MAQTTLLTSGNTAVTSADVTLAAGVVAVVGVFTANSSDALPSGVQVLLKTPAADNIVAVLNGSTRQVQITGPGTFRVKRPAGSACGVFLEQ